jgi:hypothetical protein
MQTIIQVSCKPRRGHSLRQRIVNDDRIGDHGLVVHTRRMRGRNPGWAKVRSTEGDAGAINIEWDASTNTLLARVVTRQSHPAAMLIGRFLGYVLSRHSKQVRAITLLP